MAQKRRPMSRNESKKNFARGNKVNSKNVPTTPMRGGVRL